MKKMMLKAAPYKHCTEVSQNFCIYAFIYGMRKRQQIISLSDKNIKNTNT